MEVLAGRAPFQIAFAVHDLEATARRFDALLRAGPWRGYVFDEPDWALRLALTDGHPQYELVQPLRGESIHQRWLDDGRTGMHHLGYVVDSIDAGAAEFESAGHPVVMEARGFGAAGDGRAVYVDTVATLGFYVELVEPPRAMPAKAFTL